MMQSNSATSDFGTKHQKKIILIFKSLFFGAMMWYLYSSIQEKGAGFKEVYRLIISNISTANTLSILFLIILTPLNWACEALKWQTLAKRVEKLSFTDAFRGVLVGLSFGVLMPANVADAAGRVVVLRTNNRLKAIGAALLANGFQFYVSIIFGTIGWVYLVVIEASLQRWYGFLLIFLLICTLIFGLLLLLNRQNAAQYLVHFRWFGYIKPYLDVIVQYQKTELQTAFRWAVLRYLVFTLQFWLVTNIFNIKLSFLVTLMSIFVVFFAKTIIPALNFLGDLGVRETAALFVFGFFDITPTAVVAATLTLWLINILVPVLVGAGWFFLMKKKNPVL
jgi:uncharacterized membrane protein YbhN (UPF0104 family)